jgi:hypothetical protein
MDDFTTLRFEVLSAGKDVIGTFWFKCFGSFGECHLTALLSLCATL